MSQAAERERHGSASDASDSEEGEISHRDSFRFSPSPPRRSPDPTKREREPKQKVTDLDGLPANRQEVNSARLSRYEMVDMMYKDGFEELVKNAYVRLMSGDADEMGRPKYRVYKVLGGSMDQR